MKLYNNIYDEFLNDDQEHIEIWDQKVKFNNEERAKMILDTLENDEELNAEFVRQSRLRKLSKLKIK